MLTEKTGFQSFFEDSAILVLAFSVSQSFILHFYDINDHVKAGVLVNLNV